MAKEIILGAVAGELLRKLLELKDKAVNFTKAFKRLQDTLEYVVPLFDEVSKMGLGLMNDRKRKSIEELQGTLVEGQDLVVSCSKVRYWDIYRKIRLSRQIMKLDEAILSFCQQELQVEIWHDNKQLLCVNNQILHKVEQIERKMNGLSLQNGQTNSSKGFFDYSSLCAVPDLPDHRVVGSDITLRELMIGLLEEEVSELDVPSFFGNSTRLRRDEAFRECFLKLDSFPEDRKIPISDLMNLWFEPHGPEDEDDVIARFKMFESSFTRKIAMETGATYNELFVTQHKLLRELAMYGTGNNGMKHLS